MKITELIPDDKNFNKGNEFGNALIEKSLRKFGAARSIVIDKNNRIIAGNKTVENAGAIGMEDVVIVETTGEKIVAVKRTDIDLDTDKGRQLALADNQTAKANIEWDFEILEEEVGKQTMKEWGIDPPDPTETEKLSSLEYESIYYEPEHKPNIDLAQCIDLTKFHKKIEYLHSLDICNDRKELLTLFAYRFIRIDFESVANYYFFNASPEEKKAIERLRMVLCDNGINGFIEDDLLRIYDSIQWTS